MDSFNGIGMETSWGSLMGDFDGNLLGLLEGELNGLLQGLGWRPAGDL